MPRRLTLVALAAVVLVLLTGCIRASTEIRVDDDGSGTYQALVAVDEEAFSDALGAFGSIDDLTGGEPLIPPIEDIQAELPEGATVVPYDEDGFRGFVVSAPFTDVEDLQQLIAESGGSSAMSPTTISNLVLEPDGDGWRFELQTSGTEEATDDGGLLGGDELDSLLEGFVFEFALNLPGTVVEQNADRVTSDGTLVWELGFGEPPRTLSARSEPGDPVTGDGDPSLVSQQLDGGGSDDDDGGGGSGVVIAVVAVVIIAAVVALVLVLRSRRKGHQTGSGPTGPGPSAGGPPTGWGSQPGGGQEGWATAPAAPPAWGQPPVGQPPVAPPGAPPVAPYTPPVDPGFGQPSPPPVAPPGPPSAPPGPPGPPAGGGPPAPPSP